MDIEMQPNPFAAELLERSASGLAGYASSALIERDSGIDARYPPDAFAAWKANLTQRVLELSAALAAGEPRLFESRMLWSRKAFLARNQDTTDIEASLAALREVLRSHLPKIPASDCETYIAKALEALKTEQAVLDESELNPARPHDRIALQYLQAVLEGNAPDAIDIAVRSASEGLDATGVYLKVLMPAQREIGRLWHLGDVTIAEEHMVTATTQRAMAILVNAAEHRAPANGKTVVAAAVSGNAHDVGLRAVADLFQLAGWRAIFLGSNVPAREMPATLTFFDADILLLSATLSTQIPKVAEAIQLVRDRCERPVRIIVGGAAFDEASHLWERMGADGYAESAEGAVSLGAQLAGS